MPPHVVPANEDSALLEILFRNQVLNHGNCFSDTAPKDPPENYVVFIQSGEANKRTLAGWGKLQHTKYSFFVIATMQRKTMREYAWAIHDAIEKAPRGVGQTYAGIEVRGLRALPTKQDSPSPKQDGQEGVLRIRLMEVWMSWIRPQAA